MYKIKKMLPCNTHKPLESYIYDRKFAVRCNTAITDLLYTADIPTSTRLTTSTFADDTAILNRSKCPMQASVHLDRRLTWHRHIKTKRTPLKLKASRLHWLINARCPLSLEYKVLLYNSVLKPIWMYSSQLWGNASNSNIDIVQRAQSKILRTITGAP